MHLYSNDPLAVSEDGGHPSSSPPSPRPSPGQILTSETSGAESTPAPTTQQWFTIAEAAQFLRFSRSWVAERITSGELKAHRVGRNVRISKDALDALLHPYN